MNSELNFKEIFSGLLQEAKQEKESFENNPENYSNMIHAIVPCDQNIPEIEETGKTMISAISIDAISFVDDAGHSISQECINEYLSCKERAQALEELHRASCEMSQGSRQNDTYANEVLLLTQAGNGKRESDKILEDQSVTFIAKNPKKGSPHFTFKNGNLYYVYYDHENKMQEYIVSNFKLEIMKQLIIFGRENDQGKRETYSIYTINVKTANETFQIKIRDSQIEKVTWISSHTHAKAHIKPDHEKKVREYINTMIEKENYPHLYHYESNGWTQLFNGEFVYLTDKGAIGSNFPVTGNEKYSFIYDKNMSESNAILDYINMLQITTDHMVPGILMLETLLGCLNSLFERAGYPNKKGLFIIGQTQSMKTTLALMFTKVYNRDDLSSPTLSFSSTACGIEEKLSEVSDAAIVLDDLAPKLNKTEMSALLSKLEQVIRAIGDRVVKHRMTAYSTETKDISFPVKSSVIITGEMIDGMQSSLARLIQLELKRSDINLDLLTQYQQTPNIVSTALFHFIKYITTNVPGIISYIGQSVKEKRSNYNNLFFTPRFQEYKAVYETVIDIFMEYIAQLSVIDSISVNNLKNEFYYIVDSVLIKNDENLKTETIPERIAEAVKSSVTTGEISLYYPDDPNGFTRNGILVLDDYYVIYPDTLLRVLKTYFKNKDLTFYCNSVKSLSTLLDGAHFIMSKMEGNKKRFTHKLSKQIGTSTTRYYYLHRKYFEEK